MLPHSHRIRTREIQRLFSASYTQKIVAYPFVYFIGKQRVVGPNAWGIQLSTKLAKSSVQRHILKRAFYDCVQGSELAVKQGYRIFAVPHKTWADDIRQILATGTKTTIVQTISAQYRASLSSLAKKRGSSVESNTQSTPSNNASVSLKKTKNRS